MDYFNIFFALILDYSVIHHFRIAHNTTLSSIGHFRVPPSLFFKTKVAAQPLIWKSFFILMEIKHIFTRKVVHLASF